MAGNKGSDNDLLTVVQIAREYRIGRDRLRKMLDDSQLPYVAVGNRRLVPRWAFLEWVRDNTRTASQHLTPS